jgi:hypothetical protein
MNNRDPITLLRYEAGRRPEVAALVARAETGQMTDAEIAAAPVPLPWYRAALTRVRDQAVITAMKGSIEEHIISSRVQDEAGFIAEYTGIGAYTEGNHGVRIEPGNLLFFPDETDSYWLDTVFVARGAGLIKRETVPVGRGTRSSYQDVRQERLARLHPDAVVIDLTQDASAPARPGLSPQLAAMGVRIG